MHPTRWGVQAWRTVWWRCLARERWAEGAGMMWRCMARDMMRRGRWAGWRRLEDRVRIALGRAPVGRGGEGGNRALGGEGRVARGALRRIKAG